MNREKVKKATARQRVNARVMALSAGRWDIVRPVKAHSAEEWLETFFEENVVLCRETFKRSMAAVAGSPYMRGEEIGRNMERGAPGDAGRSAAERTGRSAATGFGGTESPLSWKSALDILRIWEYTGRIRRGYFVEGLSGAQFIRSEVFDGTVAALRDPETRVLWFNGTDPANLWGRVLEIPQERSFLAVPGTAVALCSGRLAAVMERQGKVLRVHEPEVTEEMLEEFVNNFRQSALFPEVKRLTVKEYPPEAGEALAKAGFIREMNDFVLYR